MKKYLFTTLALVILPFFVASSVFAQTEALCGNVYGPVPSKYTFGNTPIVEQPITDCDDPFTLSTEYQNPYTLKINQTVVSNGGSIAVPEGKTRDYKVTGSSILTGFTPILYKHDGQDLRYVEIQPPEFTDADLETYIDSYFSNQLERDFYRTIVQSNDKNQYFYDENGEPLVDAQGRSISGRYYDFEYNSTRKHYEIFPEISEGEYTLLLVEYLLTSSNVPWYQKLADFIIPTAHAITPQTNYPEYRFAIDFTITKEEVEPQGASSVLFLPGIMGSRLYEIGQQCGDFGDEQERWFSTTDCKQLRLLTGSDGNSLNDVYTKAGASSVIDETFGFNLYKTFFASLDDLKGEGIINNYKLVPYDWRMRLDYLLKAEKDDSGKIKYNPTAEVSDSYLYKELEQLVASSTTGKVTIVAHSNGGLVAKTLLATLQNLNDPLLAKIDNLILVGSPQLGTPSTLLGMLHGDEVGPYGSVVSQLTTRRLLNNMPMAFHLLPNDSYFNSSGVTVDTPVIQFEAGTLTTPWANAFGSSIDSASELKNFLTTDSGRMKPAIPDLVNPEVIPKFLFDNYTANIDQLMNTWTPPASMKVYQIAGTGLPTQSGLTYFTDKECVARDILKLFKCTAYQDKLGVRPNDTIDGDATVVTPSALGISSGNLNMQRWWLNLKNYNDDTVINRVHKDILEVEDVINFIKNTLTTSTSSSYEYLTSSPPNLGNENRLVFDLHSPLDLLIVTNDGVVSSSSVTIEGATYKRFGEMQHISMPNITGKKTVVLTGEATGSFTLEIGEQEGNAVTKRHTYSAIPSGTSTKVSMELDSAKPIEQAILAVDYDGNGMSEIIYNTIGEVMPEVTYSTLRTAVNNLNIKSLYKKLLLENIKIAEQYQIKSAGQVKYKKLELLSLNVLKQQVILYERLKLLTSAQKQELIIIIDKLIIK